MSNAPSTKAKDSSSGQPSEGGDEALASLRLDALSAGGMEALTEAAPKKRIPVHIFMLAGLVLVAGGSLFVMRKLGMGPVGAMADIKIDYDTKNIPATGDHQKVLHDLTASHIEQQVPKEQVQRNPFRLADSLGGRVDEPRPPDEDEQARKEREEKERLERERAERLAHYHDTASSLKLHSIIGGSKPIARINDETVRVGDKVAETFFVKSIQGRSVELEVDGLTFVLGLDGLESEPAGEPVPANKQPAHKEPTTKPKSKKSP